MKKITTFAHSKPLSMTCRGEHILLLLQKNDNQAYKYLYDNFFYALKSLAEHYTHSESIASDVVQDVFVSMLSRSNSFDSIQSLKLFLFKSVKNGSISYIRQLSSKQKFIDSQVVTSDVSIESDDIFMDKLLEEEVYLQLMNAIKQLPPKCRMVMEQTLSGKKAADIAKTMNVSLDTVKEHKKKGKQKLFELLSTDKELLSFILLFF